MDYLLALWTRICLAVFDPLLGWLLVLPTDLLLLFLAIITAVMMTLIRRWTTDQDLLERVAADKTRVKALRRAAKAAGDRAAVERFTQLGNRHGLKALTQEGRPLLWSVLPIAMLASWAMERVDLVPPSVGQPVMVSVLARPSVAGELVHVVPGQGLATPALVQRFVSAEVWAQPCAKATWTFTGEAGEHQIAFRSGTSTWTAPLRIGDRTYSPPLTHDPDETTIMVELPQRRLLGIVPGWDAIGFPPWLIGYLLLVIPLAFLAKPLMRTR